MTAHSKSMYPLKLKVKVRIISWLSLLQNLTLAWHKYKVRTYLKTLSNLILTPDIILIGGSKLELGPVMCELETRKNSGPHIYPKV